MEMMLHHGVLARSLARALGLGLGVFSLLAGSRAKADFYLHPWRNESESADAFRLGIDLLYYNSSSNYDSNHSAFTPTYLNGYSRIENDLTLAYGLNPAISVFGRLTWLKSQVDNIPFSGTVSGGNVGLGDQTVGINYRLYEKPDSGTRIHLQLQSDFPAYSNPSLAAGTPVPSDTSPYLGDGSTDVTAGAFLTIPVARRAKDDLNLVAGAGYTYRTSGYSSAIPWSVSGQLVPHRGKQAGGLKSGPEGEKDGGWTASLTVFGIQSLQNDTRSSSPPFANNSLASSPGTAGSYITGAINPTLATVQGRIGYLTSSDLGFVGSVAHSFFGQNAPNGLTIALGFQTSFGGGTSDRNPEMPVSVGPSGASALEARVLRANDRFGWVRLDKGSQDGVALNDFFDVFAGKADGSAGPAIARGHVTNVRPTESALKIDEYYKESWIEEGFIARRAIR